MVPPDYMHSRLMNLARLIARHPVCIPSASLARKQASLKKLGLPLLSGPEHRVLLSISIIVVSLSLSIYVYIYIYIYACIYIYIYVYASTHIC